MAITKTEYILALDQGTTGTRAIIYNHNARRAAATEVAMTSLNPQEGWVEQRPLDIWRSAQTAIADVLIKAGVRGDQIKAIGIANQRETTIVWNRHTGQPIYNAIVWSSSQSQEVVNRIADKGYTKIIRDKTGLPLSAYFSASKIRWILDQVSGAQEAAEAGELLFGTVDTWLIWNLTDGKSHVTDMSNAARTMLFNLDTLEWDKELLELFNIPHSMLPTVNPSQGIIAITDPMQFFGGAIPIAGVIGDQNASLVGQLTTEAGMVKNTYGAGAFLIMNTGHEKIASQRDLVTTIAYQVGDQPTYALEGSIFTAGTALQWLHDRLNLVDNQVDIWRLAEQSTNENEVYVIPAFNGLGAPYWDPQARGSVFGLTRGTQKADFVKATLQSIAYQTADILTIMTAESHYAIKILRADGSVSRNPYLMQFQSDVADVVIDRAADEDTTPLGAAFLAGVAVGYWADLTSLKALLVDGRQFEPKMTGPKRTQLRNGWQQAIDATQYFAQQVTEFN